MWGVEAVGLRGSPRSRGLAKTVLRPCLVGGGPEGTRKAR